MKTEFVHPVKVNGFIESSLSRMGFTGLEEDLVTPLLRRNTNRVDEGFMFKVLMTYL